ncbi:MAG: hypothetical protein LBV67_05240 [Streptococcaceae bacterium]|jgi:hypothetical protein|nr:hypothetical protein [Streptococcaceae bacterium]
MLKKLKKYLPIALFLISISFSIQANASGIDMFRLYNPNSGEHFYTASVSERNNLVKVGWIYEGIGWNAPASGNPVYRLYDPNSGDHHYTVNVNERNALVRVGWKNEGVGWYSGGQTPLHRSYNPNAKTGSHNYTTNRGEHNALIKAGWINEGIAWYGQGAGKTTGTPSAPTPQVSAGYKANNIYVSGKTIPYKNGGVSQGQAIIDSYPNGIASTWGGMSPFSGTDGLNTHFIGHHWGAFDPFIPLAMGAKVTITDANGRAFDYKVNSIVVTDTKGVDQATGRSIFGEITSTGGGERVVFQTCIDTRLRRIIFCVPM